MWGELPLVCSYLEKNLIFFSPLWEDWRTHGIRVYNHIPPVELLWCGLLFLCGSLPGCIPQQQLCAGRTEQRLRWCVPKLCIHTWRWQDTQPRPCIWLFCSELNVPAWYYSSYLNIIILLLATCCVYSFSLQMCLHASLSGLAHYNFVFCITHAKLCDTAPLYQGQVWMGGWWVPAPVKPSLAFPAVFADVYTILPYLFFFSDPQDRAKLIGAFVYISVSCRCLSAAPLVLL